MKNVGSPSQFTCTGCAACKAICPTNAIDYSETEDGFFEASVDSLKCVDCGKCQTVCYKYINAEQMGGSIFQGIAVSAKSADAKCIQGCTSGGIAHEIAKWGIENQYWVAGTVYDYQTDLAKMKVARTFEEIEEFRGSKYLQSKSDEAMIELRDIAKKHPEQRIMVFGVPCQILGVKRLFETSNLKNELLLVDLFCHGVPSYLTWNAYLKERGFEYLKRVDFRSKKMPWHFYAIELQDDIQKADLLPSAQNPFYKVFFDNVGLHRSCSDCQMRKGTSSADIRLGDYWGKKYKNDFEGVSACVAVTEKGDAILQTLSELRRITILDKETVDEIAKAQSVQDYPSSCQEKTQQYFKILKDTKKLKVASQSYSRSSKMYVKELVKKWISYLPLTIQIAIRKI